MSEWESLRLLNNKWGFFAIKTTGQEGKSKLEKKNGF